MNPEFVRVLDFQDGLVCIFHYEFASNFDLIGKPNCGKSASETSHPSGNIATGLSRYAGIDEGLPSPSGSGFFMRKGDEK